jgi:hypothetical protein
MLDLHQQRYPYSHDADLIVHNFEFFELADEDFNYLLQRKYWEFIRKILKPF